MTGRIPVSAFLITRNEAHRVGAAIESVRDWVDEVVVVDSGSDDGTVELCRELGAFVSFREWPGYGQQKRNAEDLCRNAWLLNLDADERVTPELAREIVALFEAGEPPEAGYYLRIADVFPHEVRPARWAYDYNAVRLYNRDAGRYSHSTVHDRVQFPAEARLGQLRGLVHHHSHTSLFDTHLKLNRYTDAQARNADGRRMKWLPLRLVVEFPVNFLKAYLGRRYFVRGMFGFVLAMQYAYGRFLRLAKMWERRRGGARPPGGRA